jgi:hypothetical protein
MNTTTELRTWAQSAMTHLASTNAALHSATENPEFLLSWGGLGRQVLAQADATVADRLTRVLDRAETAGLDEEAQMGRVRDWALRELRWVTTPASTNPASNLLDAALNDARVSFARDLGVLPF